MGQLTVSMLSGHQKVLVSSNSFKRKGLPTDDKESPFLGAISKNEAALCLWFYLSTTPIIY